MENEKNPQTFEEVYSRFSERVLTIIFHFTHDEETSRDLMQDVFIKVHSHLGSFKGESHVFTWIHRITVNHVLNHLRREKRRRLSKLLDRPIGDVFEGGESDVEQAVASRDPLPDQQLEQDERKRLVWAAIDALPVKYRIPWVLFWSDGLSQQEIADSLGISRNAVEVRIHRAKRKLVGKLEPWIGHI